MSAYFKGILSFGSDSINFLIKSLASSLIWSQTPSYRLYYPFIASSAISMEFVDIKGYLPLNLYQYRVTYSKRYTQWRRYHFEMKAFTQVITLVQCSLEYRQSLIYSVLYIRSLIAVLINSWRIRNLEIWSSMVLVEQFLEESTLLKDSLSFCRKPSLKKILPWYFMVLNLDG